MQGGLAGGNPGMSSVSGASVQSSTDVLTGGWSMVTGIQVQMLEAGSWPASRKSVRR